MPEETEKKYYQVFSVDMSFDPWSMNYVLIGGESEDDVASHLKEIYSFIGHKGKRVYFNQKYVKRVIKEKTNRIVPINDLFTTAPYKLLDTFGYYE